MSRHSISYKRDPVTNRSLAVSPLECCTSLIEKARMSKASHGQQTAVSYTYKDSEVLVLMPQCTPKSKATPYWYNGKPYI